LDGAQGQSGAARAHRHRLVPELLLHDLVVHLLDLVEVRPLSCSFSITIEAAAWLIVQPSPVNVTSSRCSPSGDTLAKTVTISPQPGLPPGMVTSASARARRFTGCW